MMLFFVFKNLCRLLFFSRPVMISLIGKHKQQTYDNGRYAYAVKEFFNDGRCNCTPIAVVMLQATQAPAVEPAPADTVAE